jgi:alpha-tubulin suppressor-like RCC1 family protein
MPHTVRSLSPAGRAAIALAAALLLTALLVLPARAVADDTKLVAWGANLGAGLGQTGDVFTPGTVTGADDTTAVAAGASRTLLLTPTGVLVTGNTGTNGNLGLGTSVGVAATPTPIPDTAGTVGVAAGSDSSLLLAADGTVSAFGRNQYGSAGGTLNQNRYTPGPVAGLDHVAAVSSGLTFSLALKDDGTVWAWGQKAYLGSTAAFTAAASATGVAAPVQVPLPDGLRATQIAAGRTHGLALLEDGSVAAWGAGANGQLGDGTTTATRYDAARVTGFPIAGGPAVSRIAAGFGTSFALLADGTYRSWGRGVALSLGLGTGSADVLAPTAPTPATLVNVPTGGFVDLAAGSTATYARGANGYVYAWGNNGTGQLAQPAATTGNEVPTRVGVLHDVPWLAQGSSGGQQIVRTGLVLRKKAGSDDSFFEQQVGTISRARDVVVESYVAPSTVTRVSITGAAADDFLIVAARNSSNGTVFDSPASVTFPLTLPEKGTLGTTIRFAPSAEGERFATLNVYGADETLRVPISGYGVPLTGGPAGDTGATGAAGSPGRDGTNGRDGRDGAAGVLAFVAAQPTTTVRRGRTASVRFVLANGTASTLAATTATATLPKALAAGTTSKRIAVKALGSGATRTLSLSVKVGRKANVGTRTVRLALRAGGATLVRTAKVKVTR